MLQIRNTKDDSTRGLAAMVYSEAGVGKTTLAKEFKEILVIDLEGGRSVLDDGNISYVTVNVDDFIKNEKGKKVVTIQPLIDIINDIEKSEFKTIMFDSSTKLEDILLMKYAETNPTTNTPSLQNYGQLNIAINQLFLKLIHLRELGKNILVTALEQRITITHDDLSTRTELYPLIKASKGTLIKKIVGDFDIVGRLKIGKTKRYLQVQPLEGEFAKSRIHKSQGAILPLDLFNKN